jgi:hypothetical protein
MPKKNKKKNKKFLLTLIEALDALYSLRYSHFFGSEYTPPVIPEVLTLILKELRSRGCKETYSLEGSGSDEGWGFYILLIDSKIEASENFQIYFKEFSDKESEEKMNQVVKLTNIFEEIDQDIISLIQLIENYIKKNV